MSETIRLNVGESGYDCDVVTGTEGEKGIRLGKMHRSTGVVTLDPGFVNTASCTSDITYIDGDNGILRYRGYPIEELAKKSNFLETAFLLIFGELPSQSELDEWVDEITHHTLIHENMKRFFYSFPANAHPMAILASVVTALSTFYQGDHDPRSEEQIRLSAIRLIAKLPTIAAFSYKTSQGQPFVYPDNRLPYAGNFLKMMFGLPSEPYELDPEVAEILDMLLLLHADHEQNCSASTVRIVGSSHTNLFACIAAGILALWGPLHGGANQRVLEMLQRIQEDGGNVDKYVEMAKNKESGFRLMGFGHRVYKNFDPRATIIKKACDKVLAKFGGDDGLLGIAKELEAAALEDDYFKERRLYPNVDFYSGIIYRALGIPTEMMTVMFSMGRLAGWIAQWKESVDHNYPIGRPRQIYTGESERTYVPLENRG